MLSDLVLSLKRFCARFVTSLTLLAYLSCLFAELLLLLSVRSSALEFAMDEVSEETKPQASDETP
jgi:hypothetical protein